MNELQTRRVAALVLVAAALATIAVLILGKILWGMFLLTCGLLVWIVVTYAGENPRRWQHTAVVFFSWSVLIAFLIFARFAVQIDMWGGARLRFAGLVAGVACLVAGALGYLVFHALQKNADQLQEVTSLLKGSEESNTANI